MLSEKDDLWLKGLLDDLMWLRKDTENRGIRKEQQLQISAHDLRTGAFGLIFNETTLSAELLHYYIGAWRKDTSDVSATDSNPNEGADRNSRVLSLLRHLFVLSMSAIEYSAKSALAKDPTCRVAIEIDKSLRNQKNPRIYLRKIMDISKQLGLIDKSSADEWDGIIEIRNMVVHNNGIPDESKNYLIRGMNVNLVGGTMPKVKMNFFIELTAEAVKLFDSWVLSIWPN